MACAAMGFAWCMVRVCRECAARVRFWAWCDRHVRAFRPAPRASDSALPRPGPRGERRSRAGETSSRKFLARIFRGPYPRRPQSPQEVTLCEFLPPSSCHAVWSHVPPAALIGRMRAATNGPTIAPATSYGVTSGVVGGLCGQLRGSAQPIGGDHWVQCPTPDRPPASEPNTSPDSRLEAIRRPRRPL